MKKLTKQILLTVFGVFTAVTTISGHNLHAEKLMTDSTYKNVSQTQNGNKYVINASLEQLKLQFDDKLMYKKNTLTNKEKLIWDYLYKILINFNGESNDKITYTKQSSGDYYKINFKDLGVKASFKEIYNIYKLLIADEPRFYFIDIYPVMNEKFFYSEKSADVDSDGNLVTLKMYVDKAFNKPGVYNNSLMNIEASASKILSKIKPWMNQRQIAVLLSTEIHSLVRYKFEEAEKYPDEYNNKQAMNGAFGIHHFGVCEAYAKALQYLMLRTGMDVIWTGGFAYTYTGAHSWDLVNFSGKWYMMDPTWGWTVKGADDSDVKQRSYLNNVYYQDHPALANTPSNDYIYLPNENHYKKYVANLKNVEVQVNGVKQISTTKTFDQNLNLGTFDNVDLTNVKFNLNQDEYVGISGVKTINKYSVDQIESKQRKDGTFTINIKTKIVKPVEAQKIVAKVTPRRVPSLKIYAKFGKNEKRLLNIRVNLNKPFKLHKNNLHLNSNTLKVISKRVHGRTRYFLVGVKANKNYKIRKVNINVSKNSDKVIHIYVYKR